MKSFALQSQVIHLGLQLYASHKRFLPDTYKKATLKRFSYLVVILHPMWEDQVRVVTEIIPPENLIVFLPK